MAVGRKPYKYWKIRKYTNLFEFVGGVRMKCPECGNEFKKGVIEAKDAGV